MPTIEFTKEYTVQSVPPETHEAGKRMVVTTASARHFTVRGVAKLVDDAEPKVKKSQPAPKASETGGSSQQAPASQKATSKRRGRPPKQETEEPSPSTTTTDSQD